jgi:phosphate transport system substrate-binding protein
MMKKWSLDYWKVKGIEIDYTASGSGNGVAHMIHRKNDFGCTDAPMSEEQLRQAMAAGGEVVHIPLVLGAVVVVYNLDEVKELLQLTGPVVADIFLGKITRWNDPAIKELNPGVDLPDKEIAVVHRGDASGTSYIFTDYLSKVSGEWKDKVGTSNDPNWPVGDAAPKAVGVGGLIAGANGSIGYVELTYAEAAGGLKTAKIENRDGRFIQADLASVTAAAEGALPEMPDSLRFSLVNAPGKNSYPICGAVWAVAYAQQTGDKGDHIVDFLTWATHGGQESVANLGYARLPSELVRKIEAKVRTVGIGD